MANTFDFITRTLPSDYTPTQTQVNAVVRAAIPRLLVHIDTLGEHTMKVWVKHYAAPEAIEAAESIGERPPFTDHYQGDPGGRFMLVVECNGMRARFKGHAPRIYSHLSEPPGGEPPRFIDMFRWPEHG